MAEKGKINKITAIGLFSGLIIVLQIFATFINFGQVNITLALVPIIVGAAIYGKRFGTILGTVLGVANLCFGILGWDKGFVLALVGINPAALIFMCIAKTAIAGFLAGVIYEAISNNGTKHELGAIIVAGIVCPAVNTGIFVLFMILVFKSYLGDMALTVFLASIGVNFIVELTVNMLLATGMTTATKALSKKRVK